MARQSSMGPSSPKAALGASKVPALPTSQSNMTGASTLPDTQDDDAEADHPKNDEDEDVLGPLTSPLAARAHRSATPLTSANLAKANAASNGNEWADLQEDNMFNETQDQDSQDEEASEIEVADDDDNYDGVDNISQISDSPSNESREFEAEVEREIRAAGEGAIDWENDETYRYNAAFSEHSYAMYTVDNDNIDTMPDVFNSSFRQPSAAPPTSPKPFQDEFLKGTPLDPLENDWPSSSSENDDDEAVKKSKLGGRNNSEGDDSDQEDASEAQDDDDDYESSSDSTDDGQPILDHIKTPSVTLINRHSPNPLPHTAPIAKRRSMAAPETPVPRREPGKFSAMKRLKLAPGQAIAYARSSPQGRIVCFTQPREGHFRFVSARTSRSSSFDSGTEIQDPVLRARFIDACKSVLFRRQVCAPTQGMPQSPLSSSVPRFGHSMLSSPFNSFNNVPIDETIASSIEDDVSNLIDFDGNNGEEDVSNVGSSPGPPPPPRNLKQDLLNASMPPPPPVKQVSQDLHPPRTPESTSFPIAASVPAFETPSPKKRRNENAEADEDHSTLTPAMKKQRVDSTPSLA